MFSVFRVVFFVVFGCESLRHIGSEKKVVTFRAERKVCDTLAATRATHWENQCMKRQRGKFLITYWLSVCDMRHVSASTLRRYVARVNETETDSLSVIVCSTVSGRQFN